MKAFGYEKNGGPEVFQEYEVPIPGRDVAGFVEKVGEDVHWL